MEDIKNPYVKANWESLKTFLENINCLYDSFEYSENMLRSQNIEARREYNSFIRPFLVKVGDSPVQASIPTEKEKQHQHLNRKLNRSEESSKLLLRSYIVSMVSQFDAFIASLLRNIYAINPDKLKQSEHKLTFAELQNFASIDEAREYIIDSKIENILRDSHQEQFKELADSIGVDTLKKFDNWPNFVEITQRRNLFVHSNGVVSSQYLGVCKSEGVTLGELKKGVQLEVDKSYFVEAFNVFYEVAVKLSQMALRILLYKKDKSCLGDIDKCIITNIYDLIADERYDVAIELSNFALDDKFRHNDKDRIYLILNRAQAYKWKGEDAKCQSLLAEADTSAWSGELKCPKYALEGKLDKVCEIMQSTGKNGEILKAEQYRNWPIFKEVRGEEKFRETFKAVFGEELEPVVELNEVTESKRPKKKLVVARSRKPRIKEAQVSGEKMD